MTYMEKIKNILDASDSGVITAKQVAAAGIHPEILAKLTKIGLITRFGRGLYIKSDAWEDDFYLLQLKYGKGIYSHDTALYLLGYSDRAPARYTMTFPQGYNAPSLKRENVSVRRAIPSLYPLGAVEINSPSGNPIYVYDLERTLCDIVRGSGGDIQLVNAAMRRYASDKNRDIHKLMRYADELHVKTKIARYMEVLL